MSKTKVITSSVSMDKVQYSIGFATTMEEGWKVAKPTHIDSSVITISVVMVAGGEFDECKREPLLKAIMDKLAEVEL